MKSRIVYDLPLTDIGFPKLMAADFGLIGHEYSEYNSIHCVFFFASSVTGQTTVNKQNR